MSARQTIRGAWKTRLESTGYPVGMGELPRLGPNDAAKFIVLVWDDVARVQGTKKLHQTTVRIHALSDAEIGESWLAVEAIVEAIKQAVEASDRRVAGLLVDPVSERDILREPGSTTVGVELAYAFQWQETWGQP